MDELPLTRKMDGALKYQHFAKITWTGSFPIDMLRHDRCCPYHEGDSSAIESFPVPTEPRTAVVTAYSESCRRSPFTIDRWKSFCCKIEVSQASGNSYI